MAEATPTEIYTSFCDEATLLAASVAGLESNPTLANLDELSAAKTRLALVQEALPALCAAADREAAAARLAALIATHAPRWSSAASAKSTALGNIVTLLGQLTSEVTAYDAAHGTQLSALASLPLYSGPFRAQYAVAPASLKTIISTIVGGDAAWMGRVTSFDPMGISPALPTE